MSEAVDILIKADDQASAKFAEVAKKAGEASDKAGTAFTGLSGGAKATKVIVKSLTELAGDSGFGSMASTLGSTAEKVDAMSNLLRKGGVAAMVGFTGAAAGMVATAGFAVGKFFGDMIFDTKAVTRELERGREATERFNEEMLKLGEKGFANEIEDIELIRDPEKKQAAIAALLDQADKGVAQVTESLTKSQAAVDEWSNAWVLFTDTRKEAAAQADIDLRNDQQRLEQLKQWRDAARELGSVRTKEVAAIKAANDAKDKSAAYLETLRNEVELLKASRDEQIKIEAARSATVEDRGEAEQLLRERDALREKAQAQQEAEDARRRGAEEAARAAQQAKEDAKQDQQRIDDLIASEEDRLELQRIELELGKEAAKAQELINQGVDEQTAKHLAAEEAAIELLRKQQKEANKPDKEKKVSAAQDLQASQSRLLTRGLGSQMMDQTNKLLQGVQHVQGMLAKNAEQQLDQQKRIANNTAGTLTLRATV